jgi:hypothetical protein
MPDQKSAQIIVPCETYVVPKLSKGKRTKRKTINQYWRDLKMLYRRANGVQVDAYVDPYEVVKVTLDPLLLFLAFLLVVPLTLHCIVYQWHAHDRL